MEVEIKDIGKEVQFEYKTFGVIKGFIISVHRDKVFIQTGSLRIIKNKNDLEEVQ